MDITIAIPGSRLTMLTALFPRTALVNDLCEMGYFSHRHSCINIDRYLSLRAEMGDVCYISVSIIPVIEVYKGWASRNEALPLGVLACP